MTSANTFTNARIEFSGIVWDIDHESRRVFKIERAGEPPLGTVTLCSTLAVTVEMETPVRSSSVTVMLDNVGEALPV